MKYKTAAAKYKVALTGEKCKDTWTVGTDRAVRTAKQKEGGQAKQNEGGQNEGGQNEAEKSALKYKNIAVTAVVALLILLLLLAYFGFASLSATFGYGRVWKSGAALPVSAYVPVTVIIDAGHGGIDPGAVENGLVEKQLNLSVAQKLADFLSLSGVETVLTRSGDELLGQGGTVRNRKNADLKERLRILESTENCVFVSIHMNKFPSPSVHGLQTFYASSSDGAKRLAQHIQERAKALDPSNNRKIKPDGKTIYILENTAKPAVLVECGFLSNKKEASLLASEAYQSQLAYAVYCGIMGFILEDHR